MSFKTDLHIHSWFSDGTMGPSAIVDRYAGSDYDLIAITDHEVLGDVEEAIELGEGRNIRVLQGIELATMNDGIELHILGYYFDTENEELNDALDRLADIRAERNEKMLACLNEMGYELTKKDLKQRKSQVYIGKPNFARALVNKGYISDIKEAFETGKFLESPEIKAIPHEKLSTEEAISLINNAGGIAVLAHPCKIKGLGERGSQEFKKAFQLLTKELKAKGLKGMECIYPEHTPEEEFFFVNTAAKFHLHITEGTDFHGDK